MGLAKHVNHALRAEVTFGSGKFYVKGLSYADLIFLKERHEEEVSELFDTIASSGDSGMNEVVGLCISKSPNVVASVIALASVEDNEIVSDEDITAAKNLPFAIQVDVLHKIGGLTFPEEDSLKKFLATALQIMRSAANGMSQSSESFSELLNVQPST